MGASSARLPAPRPLSFADWTCARAALRYLERSRQPSGLCGSTATFRGVTLWDVGSQLGGLCAARGLGLLAEGAFDAWMGQALDALGRLPLYRGELPNKCYDARTLRPVGYGRLVEEELGFSALDLSRLARWLELVAARHPSHAAACGAVTARWRLGRLERDGELMGVGLRQGAESWWQEGRLGYAQYAASGLVGLGVNAPRAADPRACAVEVEASGVRLWADTRDGISPGGHNHVTSEPYVLEGLEGGFTALPIADAQAVLGAQRVRAERTGLASAWSEDHLDRPPWFAYACVWVDRGAWRVLDFDGRDVPEVAWSSAKAAVAWDALFPDDFTRALVARVAPAVDPERGVMAGVYERGGELNQALTLNTNGVVLEALLYRHVGMPLGRWAREAGA